MQGEGSHLPFKLIWAHLGVAPATVKTLVFYGVVITAILSAVLPAAIYFSFSETTDFSPEFFLPAHTMMECLAIVIAGLIFAVGWNADLARTPGPVAFLSAVFLSVGILDFSHFMSYTGMPAFITESSPAKAIWFWLGARLVCAPAILVALFIPERPISETLRNTVIALCLVFAAFVHYLVFFHPESLPSVYSPTEGLSPFKLSVEYLIAGFFFLAILIVIPRLKTRSSIDNKALFLALVFFAVSELCFTLYSTVTDIYNFIGHTYKIIGYLLLYRIIFVDSIRRPYRLLLQSREKLYFQITHDHLTGLPNRRLLYRQLIRSLSDARSKDHRIAVIYFAIDHMRLLNEGMGHSTGDKIIRTFARRLKSDVNQDIFTARCAGNEFASIIRAENRALDLSGAVYSFIQRIQQPLNIQERYFPITASAGVAFYPEDASRYDELIEHAAFALAQAKAKGGNRLEYYHRINRRDGHRKFLIERALRHALDRQEFHLEFQPQCDVTTSRITGVEALLRWRNPELGNVSPSEFIPIAEETGQIEVLGQWVLNASCAIAAEWLRRDLPFQKIGVNISTAQFLNPQFDQHVMMVLTETGLPANFLDMEITETSLMAEPVFAAELLKRLKSIGVKISIDDFGVGYSGLSYLKHFQVNFIKVDRLFVSQMESDSRDKAIVKSVIDLAQNLNICAVAEGVETQTQLDMLRAMNCTNAQGYYFSKPVSQSEVEKLLQEQRTNQNLKMTT